VAQALTAPVLVAALVLCATGVAKLRAPSTAAVALAGAGLTASVVPVRAFASLELALGVWVVPAPSSVNCALLALTFLALSGVALMLTRRASSCGCFGDTQAPASNLHALLNAAFAVLAAAGVAWPPHGLTWVLGQPPVLAASLLGGIAGAAYATVIAYTELPAAWSAWSAQ
jgi:hypothetical protein